MNLKIQPYLLILFFFFSACTSQPYLKENAALIVFKTPTFKYADMGFVYENAEEIKAEIYGNGQALLSLKISEDLVCMSLLKCMSKQSFNARILDKAYPKDILENIFRGKQIFAGEGLSKKSNGFTQDIAKEGKYTIHYSVLNNTIIFRDTMNKIWIKVKKQ
jgi:hypothetical protein